MVSLIYTRGMYYDSKEIISRRFLLIHLYGCHFFFFQGPSGPLGEIGSKVQDIQLV